MIGERYRHYRKGIVYVVRGIALHAETKEEHVVYSDTVCGPWHTQPLERFLAEVEPGLHRMTLVQG
jgi:hypothetical protein